MTFLSDKELTTLIRTLEKLEQPDPLQSLIKRLLHCETVLKEAMRQIDNDVDIMFEGAPHMETAADTMWKEHKRCYGIGRKG